MSKITINGLNPAQHEAVMADHPRKLILAGPGSGKTKTLAAAIAREAERFGSSGIIAITYTVAAAMELERRLQAEGVSNLGFVGTLHSFCLQLLKATHPNIVVLDDEQREPMVKELLADLGLKIPLRDVMGLLDREPPMNRVLSKAEVAAKEYHVRLWNSGMVDFSGLLRRGQRMARMMKEQGNWHFSALFVDEIQDSSEADWACYEAFACVRRILVGDPDQAIYGFRGGAVTKLLGAIELRTQPVAQPSPESPSPGQACEPYWVVFRLEANYRCSESICQAANRLIANNTRRVPKLTKNALGQDGHPPEAFCADTALGERMLVSQTIEALAHAGLTQEELVRGNGERYAEMAVLARTNKLAEEFAAHLQATGIPIVRSSAGPEPEGWRMTKLLLAVLANPYNDAAVLRLVNERGLTLEAKNLKQDAAIKMVSVNELMNFRFGKGTAPSSLDADLLRHKVPADCRERVHDAARILSARGPWTIADLNLYLASKEQRDKTSGVGVTVCTAHAAKGREWATVFVVGLEEGCWPSPKNVDLEEERRLAFVAFTRAKKRLFISWAKTRPVNRGPNLPPGPPEPRQPSRFIREAGLFDTQEAVR